MWILDTCARDGIDLWYRDGSAVRCRHISSVPQFLVHVPDRSLHDALAGDMEGICPVEERTFMTLAGPIEGLAVHGDRQLAEAIERQGTFGASLYNVDIRQDQKYLAEHGLTCCADGTVSRFSPDAADTLRQVTIRMPGNPSRNASLSAAEIRGETDADLQGSERQVLADLLGMVDAADPDIILFPGADHWMERLHAKACRHGLDPPFSRTGKFRRMGSRSYWSYGKMQHRAAALIPDGRILIDTRESFVYREGGLAGVLLAARLTGLSPNLASRFTPGTLISSYEVYDAFRSGIAIPFRKDDPERVRRLACLTVSDRGGMMFQPAPGIYGRVCQIDFTSLYPAIIVRYNLSPETIDCPDRPGFLSGVLAPLLDLRIRAKREKREHPEYEGIDALLKWMLVTCFGYTGYKNAKFGRIDVHEAITAHARDVLTISKQTSEECGCRVIHGIVDCLWIAGGDPERCSSLIIQRTGLPAESERYDWIVFLPQNDGSGSYIRYYGRLENGSVRVRGIAARRHDTPAYIRGMQQEMLACLAGANNRLEILERDGEVREMYRAWAEGLASAAPRDLVISRRISRLAYSHRCLEGAAVKAYADRGIRIEAGMKIGYLVRDARQCLVEPVSDMDWDGEGFAPDLRYYRGLLDRAWDEIAYALGTGS